jgi:hypothetical protein
MVRHGYRSPADVPNLADILPWKVAVLIRQRSFYRKVGHAAVRIRRFKTTSPSMRFISSRYASG